MSPAYALCLARCHGAKRDAMASRGMPWRPWGGNANTAETRGGRGAALHCRMGLQESMHSAVLTVNSRLPCLRNVVANVI